MKKTVKKLELNKVSVNGFSSQEVKGGIKHTDKNQGLCSPTHGQLTCLC